MGTLLKEPLLFEMKLAGKVRSRPDGAPQGRARCDAGSRGIGRS